MLLQETGSQTESNSSVLTEYLLPVFMYSTKEKGYKTLWGKFCQKSLDVIFALYNNFVLCFFILLLKYFLQILILIQECFKSKLIHRFLILSCNLH